MESNHANVSRLVVCTVNSGLHLRNKGMLRVSTRVEYASFASFASDICPCGVVRSIATVNQLAAQWLQILADLSVQCKLLSSGPAIEPVHSGILIVTLL